MKVKLGDLIKPAKVIKCNNGSYPVLSMTMHSGIILQNDRFKKNLASVDQSNYKVVYKGQLVIGFPIDEGVLYIQNVVKKGIMSPAYNIWDINYNIINDKYLELCLHSPQAMQYYRANLRGTTARRRSIPTETLLKLPINLPPLDEQRHIAAVLDKVSDLIALRKKQLAKLDELVKARFVEMFGDPVLNPMGWNKIVLSKVILMSNNGMARRGNNVDGNIVLRLVELQDGFIDYIKPNRIILSEAEKKKYLLFEKDVLFARVNGNPENVGRCAVFCDMGEPIYHNDHIIRVHFDENYLDSIFVVFLLNSNYGKNQIKKYLKTSARQYTISQNGIGSIIIIFPPLDLQQKFAKFVEKVENQKTKIKQSLEILETLKKSLMQEYFG